MIPESPANKCPRCKGRGTIPRWGNRGHPKIVGTNPCPACNGTGLFPRHTESLREFRKRLNGGQ